MKSKKVSSDVVVIGGGNIGSAVSYGLVSRGLTVSMLDEGDRALRGARGNFGLVWYQGKGLGMPRYTRWCLEATHQWPAFAEKLEDQTGIRIDYHKPGGLELSYSEAEQEARARHIEGLKKESVDGHYDCELVDRRQLQRMLPGLNLGPAIVGGTYCPHDGHVNPLFLLRALHTAIKSLGGRYFPGMPATDIRHDGHAFVITTPEGQFHAPKVVMAAGLGIPKLAAMLDMKIPVNPERGQLLVTERVRPCLHYPISGIRQTAEGSFLLGVSNEPAGYSTDVTTDVIRDIAKDAAEAFPILRSIRIVRCWAALRPLTPDNRPIYTQSRTYPGAFVLTSHSGVSLASLYAGAVAHWIATGHAPEGFDDFSPRRFDV